MSGTPTGQCRQVPDTISCSLMGMMLVERVECRGARAIDVTTRPFEAMAHGAGFEV